MPVVKKIKYDKEEEFARLKMGRLIEHDQSEARIIRDVISLFSGSHRYNSLRLGPKPWRGTSRGEHARHFVSLAKYLAEPQTEYGDERLAWLVPRNLPGQEDGQELSSEDAVKAAHWMAETAALNRDTQKRGVIHYIVSFPEEDENRLNETVLKTVAKNVLKVIGAEEHQALVACHIDKAHKHVHIELNRIHPITEKPLNEFRDMVKLEWLMRKLERNHNLKPVQGRHFDRHGHWLAPNADRPAKRASRSRNIFSVREACGDIQHILKAESWKDFDRALAKRGVFLQQINSELHLVLKGTNYSAMAKDVLGANAGMEKLVDRFEQSFSEWTALKKEMEEAIKAGLSLNLYRKNRDEERRRQESKEKARKEAERLAFRAKYLKTASHPAKVSDRPSLFQETLPHLGPVINSLDIMHASKVLTQNEMHAWLKLTCRALKNLEVAIKNHPRTSRPYDLEDAAFHLREGVKLISGRLGMSREEIERHAGTPVVTPGKTKAKGFER